ncbi:MAG: triose-phosphate isomerase [archaeon]
MKPIILVNFKTYKQSSGINAVKLAAIFSQASKKTGTKFILCPQTADIKIVSCNTSLPVFAQHVDYFQQERSTGFIIPEDVRQEGASGTLLNHSEHRITFSVLRKTIERCNDANLKVVACAASVNEAAKILELNPYCIMYEDPKLVSSSKSITKIEPNSVKKFADIVKSYNKKKKTKIIGLCGAGISTKGDIELALQLGCDGVGLSSAITKASNQKKKVYELVDF